MTDYGSPNGTASIHTTNGLTDGGTYIESHPTPVPQAITWQAGYDNSLPTSPQREPPGRTSV